MKPILYTTSWCSACPAVKKYIKTHELDVEMKDIDLDEIDYTVLGIRSVPALSVEGRMLYGSGSIISYLGGMNAG